MLNDRDRLSAPLRAFPHPTRPAAPPGLADPVADALARMTAMIDGPDDWHSRCPACGVPDTTCTGHVWDGDARFVLLMHDSGAHDWCAPMSDCQTD